MPLPFAKTILVASMILAVASIDEASARKGGGPPGGASAGKSQMPKKGTTSTAKDPPPPKKKKKATEAELMPREYEKEQDDLRSGLERKAPKARKSAPITSDTQSSKEQIWVKKKAAGE